MIASVAVEGHSVVWVTLAATLGSFIGCLILFWLARKGGEKYLDRHTASPRNKKFRDWFDRYGLLTVFIPALVPIIPLPLKIFVISAGALGVRWRTFMMVILLARLPRYAALAYLGLRLGEDSMDFLKQNAPALLMASLALFLFLAILIRLREVKGRRSESPREHTQTKPAA